MKCSLLWLLAACALLCGPAQALPPGTAPDYVIYAVGGDSQVAALEAALGSLLDAVDYYSDDPVAADCEFAATAVGAQWLIAFGSTRQALTDGHGATVPAGSKLLLMLRLDGNDSGTVASLANASALAYPAVSAIAGASGDGCGLLPSYHLQTGYALGSAVPDFGIIDLDFGTLNDPGNLPGTYSLLSNGRRQFHSGAALGVAALGKLLGFALYQRPYALAVTQALYAGTAAFAHPKTGFQRAEVVGILSGTFSNWNQLYADDGTPLPNQPMVLLDRPPGNGLKAAANSYFLQAPGATRAGGNLIAYNQVSNALGGGPSTLAPPTGCSAYVDYNEPGSASTLADLGQLNAAGCLALGLVEPRSGPYRDYQLAKIGGADPLSPLVSASGQLLASYADAIGGNYDFLYSSSFVVRSQAVNGASAIYDGSFRSVFMAQFTAALQSTGLPAGNGSGSAGGLLLDPELTGASVACTSLDSRLQYAVAPLQPVLDASIGALPTCRDVLRPGGPSLLNNSSHAAFDGSLIINLLGSGLVGSSIFVDATQPNTASPLFVSPGTMIQDAVTAANTYYIAGTTTTVNHQPYRVVSTSASGYTLAEDVNNYGPAVTDGVLSNMAYVGSINPGQPGQPPPVAMTVVDFCQDPGASYGTEFCINQGYHQADHCFTDSPSDTTNCFSEMLVATAYKHPGWNNFDLIAAFQQTAANWNSGYAHAAYGYGAINFEAANAIASATLACPATGTPTSLCLRPPLLVAQKSGCLGQLVLLPSLTTRRRAGGFEAIYAVNPSYTWPQKNEYSAADLGAAGASLLYTSNGSDLEPFYYYSASAAGTVTFAAFTSDGKGHYSRMEAEFGTQQLSFNQSDVGCQQSANASRPAAPVFHSTVIKRP